MTDAGDDDIRRVLSRQLDGTLVGVILVAIALVVLVWGAVLLADARAGRDRAAPWWTLARHARPGFAFWLALFLVVSDGGVYAILGARVLLSGRGIEGWAFAFVAVCGVLALAAFSTWARERRAEATARIAAGEER